MDKGESMSETWKIEQSGYTSLRRVVDERGETVAVGVRADHAERIVAALQAQEREAALLAALERPVRENLHEATCRAAFGGYGDGCSCWLSEARAAIAQAGERQP